jgi:hypothetical protein
MLSRTAGRHRQSFPDGRPTPECFSVLRLMEHQGASDLTRARYAHRQPYTAVACRTSSAMVGQADAGECSAFPQVTGRFVCRASGGCGIRTHDYGHPQYRFSRPAHSATMRTLQALPPRVEDSAGGPGRIGVWGRKVAGMVWATADRPPGVRTEVGAMSRSFKDMARTVRSAH